jgi:hypothetical protein
MAGDIPDAEESSEVVASVSSESRLDTPLEKMLTAGKDQLSVEDETGKPVGILNTECFHAVLSNSSQGEED